MVESEQLLAALERWLEDAVIGLGLCPFAAPVQREGRVYWSLSGATTPDDALRDVLREAESLLDSPERSTTLVLLPQALSDFEEFLDAVYLLEELLEESGAHTLLQLAHFHPRYRFAGEDPGALSHFTNRTPCPVVQLLRVEEVSEAVDGHPDPNSIPQDNIDRLEALGRDAVHTLWQRFGWLPEEEA